MTFLLQQRNLIGHVESAQSSSGPAALCTQFHIPGFGLISGDLVRFLCKLSINILLAEG